MLISLVFHVVLLLLNCTVGFVLSSLYVPLATLEFPATSYAHTYKYLVHSVSSVILVPLVYAVPFDQQCANVALAFHVQ